MTFPRIFQSGRTALLWLLCCALPVSGLRAAAVPLAGIETDPHSKVDMRVTTAFKELTPTGFATLQIYVHNSSGQARSWLFHFDSSGGGEDRYQSSRQITVPDNAEQTFEVLVPLLAGDSQNFYSSLSINVSGYGLAGTSSSLSSNSSSGSTTDYLLMSTSLYTRSWGPLEKACSDRGTELIGSEFDPNYLPTDWRGYLGVGTMLITDTEFHDLDPVLRNAIHEWVLQGGSLVICSTTQHQPGDFGYHDEHPGYGHLKLVQWDGRELDAGVAMPLILARDHSVAANVSNGYNTRWSLAGAIGKLQFNGTFIMLFVVCFGLVIGPMNLFRFAKSGQRHKLFWTTPAISIAGSIVLALVIYLQDGLGGTGKRMTLVQLVTGENDAIVTQEQISRTGLLISSGFKTEDKVFISPIYNLPASTSAEWVGVKNQSRTYNQDGNSESG
ncbi:MAG TPA: hypothetical protein VG733_08215, partial [Chthoniobacteraceae bacterium]|nr:hypothetical protein [Chthoniobacteraceae bacterium]